jgi:hypothetical protein
MPSELEQQFDKAFSRLPKPTREATRQARVAALSALAPRERSSRAVLLVAVLAAVAAAAVGAAALAASGNLHVRLGGRARTAPTAPTRLSVPPATHGLAVVAGGRLWLTTRGGLRIEGMRATTAELSPNALFAVAGIGSSLVALAPGNRRPWVQDVGGPVLSASWSPDGLKIAYVVARHGRDELRLIEGDGAPDQLLVRSVAAVKPAWRPDSLSIGYVDRRGRPMVYDLASGQTHAFDTRSCAGPAQALAYAPAGRRLAVAGARGVAVVERWNHRPACSALDLPVAVDGLVWAGARTLVTSAGGLRGLGRTLRGYRLRNGTLYSNGETTTSMSVVAAAGSADGRFVVAFRPTPRSIELALVRVTPATRRLAVTTPLLRVRARASTATLAWR